jgi:D-glycero-alpha-D-manno-heptose 1-phosphate guanylyltransferase
MILKEAIVLAGGLGTRLRDTVPDLPKCMAPVAGRPFLFYVINYLRSQGIEKFIFSLGYKHELIEQYLEEQFSTLNYRCSIEDGPLGTGGAIWLACAMSTERNVTVVNGDTLFKANLNELGDFHEQQQAECTIALKPMVDFDRYGVVELNEDKTIRNFREKKHHKSGFINAGTYILNAGKFMHENLGEKFSFEKDYLEKLYLHRTMYALIQDGYFIDIGIPEDYNRAQLELNHPPLDPGKIDKTWTIFIDRDGVINHEKQDGYILNREEFQFYDGWEFAFERIAEKFGKIIVISNQRGVGRGLMTETDLLDIHNRMLLEIEGIKGRIDAIYYCTSTDNKDPNRKPNPGMAFKAAKEIPGIDLSKAIMIGNKPSDMLFGRNAGVYTVFLSTTNPHQQLPHPDIDLSFNSLADFAKAL